MKKIWIPILIFFAINACKNNNHDNEEVLARVYDQYLYASELHDVIPKGTQVKDSLIMAKNYINNWIRQQLIISQAENNLSDEQKDFEKQLNTYRNSLIVYKYESLLISQRLDTVVSDEEIETYYKKHPETFTLRENIVRAILIKLIEDTVDIRTIRTLIQSDDANDKAILDSICQYQAIYHNTDDTYWMSFNRLTNKIPIRTLDQGNYLRNHRYIEIKEEPFTFLARITAYLLQDEVAPIAYEKENIRRIILNKRKTQLIKDLENQLFNEALNHNNIEVY